ncbi:MAG: hypothetical protein IAF58_17440 [Leptolyngbya sp.]|nr:hypothetical protein [Candidatus Melainabacteria bacterium]
MSQLPQPPVSTANAAKVGLANSGGDKVDAPIFEGASDSIVAWTVGQAEGTRHYGEKNPAFYGHVDPGNGP